jgi:hypothetical protein
VAGHGAAVLAHAGGGCGRASGGLALPGAHPHAVRAPLAASPHLAGLTTLDLGWNQIGDAGAQALAASPHLANLTELGLYNNRIGEAGAQALAASPQLKGVDIVGFP